MGGTMVRGALLAFTLVAACTFAYSISEREPIGQPLSLVQEPEVIAPSIVAEPISPPPPAIVVSLPQRVDQASRAPVEPLRTSDGPLARRVQQELQRVGCYDRELNGIWTTSSRMATQDFMERVNARLPIDKPDEALLSLLQNQTGVVCSKSCPSDQTIDAAGRCSPVATKNANLSSSTETFSTVVTGSIPGPRHVSQPSAEENALAAPTRSPAGVASTTGHVQTAHTVPEPDKVVADTKSAGSPGRSVRKPPSTPTKYWRSFVRSVDRALGFY